MNLFAKHPKSKLTKIRNKIQKVIIKKRINTKIKQKSKILLKKSKI